MPVAHERIGLIVGTFLICGALLSFEVSTIRTINFAVGPSFIFIAIALAMLGLTAAGSVMSLFDLEKIKTPNHVVLTSLCVAIAVLVLLSHGYIVQSKAIINDGIRTAGETDGNNGIFGYLLVTGPVVALKIGLSLALPYFLFGALLSFLFSRSKASNYAGLYAADLLGAAAGCVVIVLLMETTSYAFSVTAPALFALMAAMAYVWANNKAVAGGLAVVLVTFAFIAPTGPFKALIEPAADANYLVRDYDMDSSVQERWTGWNSFTRVSAIERVDEPGQGAVLSLANGDGMAFLLPYDPDAQTPILHEPAIPALITGSARSALVVFAGAGGDMLSLHSHGVENVVGIELNERLVEGGLALEDYRLAEFLAKPGISLEVAEARAFLEKDQNTYDIVLVSWSGATIVYKLGALGGTIDHVYTYEGLSAILDSLSDEGRAIILQVNKFDMLVGLRRYMQERDLPDPARAAIVLYNDALTNDWDGPWEDNPLLIKLSGWSDAEIADITQRAAAYDYNVAYAPGQPSPDQFAAYSEVLLSDNPAEVVDRLSRAANKQFGVATDDRPFHLDHFRTERYLKSEFWSGVQDSRDNPADVFHFFRVIIVLAISALAFLLAIAPLAYGGRKVKSRKRMLVHLMYFTCLGAGFMFVEIGMIKRTSILLGNPGLTIAVILFAVILSTGIGSMLSNRAFASGLTIRTAALCVAVYAVLFAVLSPALIQTLMGASLTVKILSIVAMIFPGGFLMGQLFPQGLAIAKADDATLVPWAWAINGAMSASIAGLAPLVAQITGFQFLFFIGAGIYLLVLLLPMERGLVQRVAP